MFQEGVDCLTSIAKKVIPDYRILLLEQVDGSYNHLIIL